MKRYDATGSRISSYLMEDALRDLHVTLKQRPEAARIHPDGVRALGEIQTDELGIPEEFGRMTVEAISTRYGSLRVVPSDEVPTGEIWLMSGNQPLAVISGFSLTEQGPAGSFDYGPPPERPQPSAPAVYDQQGGWHAGAAPDWVTND